MAVPRQSDAYVALLRGINVGGKNQISMSSLKIHFEDAGCERVRTYIQSGNVVFTAPAGIDMKLAVLIPRAIERSQGIKVPLILRSGVEFKQALENNPFVVRGEDPGALHAMFLADQPDPASAAALDPNRSPGDEFAVVGRDIYLCCPNGVAKTKLTNAWFDSKLKTASTGRNWRTVVALAEIVKI